MTTQDKNTEAIIHKAAKKIFIKKGFEGARMQEIANEAGINKALLHYYYRSKDNLFESVFREALLDFIPQIGKIFDSNKSLFEKIKFFVEKYINLIIENPLIPIFVLQELNRNPEHLVNMIIDKGVNPQMFIFQIQKEVDDGNIRPIDPRQIFVNILGLCIFPFVAKPILKGVLFQNDETEFQKFIISRKKEVSNFIINAIKK